MKETPLHMHMSTNYLVKRKRKARIMVLLIFVFHYISFLQQWYNEGLAWGVTFPDAMVTIRRYCWASWVQEKPLQPLLLLGVQLLAFRSGSDMMQRCNFTQACSFCSHPEQLSGRLSIFMYYREQLEAGQFVWL